MDNLQSDNTNLNNNNKGPFLIFILSNPRSLSTVYLRTFMNAENILILSDQFTKIHIEDVQVNGSKLSMMELSKDLETKIESSLKENKTVIFKDNANFTLLYFSEVVNNWQKKFNTKYLYLVRHPKPTYVSFKKMIDQEITLIGILSIF